MNNNTSSSDRDETSTSQEENDGQEIPGSGSIQKLKDSDIKSKQESLYKVCKEKDWDTFQKFLSDETISKADKKLVLQKNSSFGCRMPIYHGAPITLIQKIIDFLGNLFIGESGFSMLLAALPNISDEIVSYELIELLVSLGGANLVNLQYLGIGNKRSLLQEYLGRNGECTRIINLLLEVGGLDLLELQDEDGEGILGFTNSTQRGIIIDFLQELDQSPRVRKHIESLTNTGVTPKEFFDWIDNCEFDRVREYLVDEEVSKEAKMECITTKNIDFELPFHKFCQRHGPVDIAKQFVDIMGIQFLKVKGLFGCTCIHSICYDTLEDYVDYDIEELDDEDFERHRELIVFILSKTGWKFLLETNDDDDSALSDFMRSLRTDLKCVKSVVNLGGKELLEYQGWSGTILHHASERENIDKEVIKYLVSVGGPKLTEAKNIWGKKAESKWSTELKEYIDLGTKTLPELCDDLKCPICFDIMSNVHVITKCCHRFCKSCITQSFEKRGNKCPVCKTKVSFHTGIRKDPLLGKITMLAKEKDDRNVSLQLELSEAMQREHVLKQQNRALVAELLNLKRKHEEM